jgi:hypothetical protein
MIKLKITFERSSGVTEARALEVGSLDSTAPVMHRVGHAIRKAPNEHRLLTLLAFAAIWALLEFVLHYEAAAKGVEIFGVAPFADRAVKFLFPGE